MPAVNESKKRVILVVDDEPGMREMLRWQLSRRGYEIQTAQDGDQAMALVGRGGIDLVLTDVTMPRADGLQLLAQARARGGGPAVILLTGFGSVETAVYAMRRGASDFILKPFDVEALLGRIQEVLQEFGLERRER
ncbi:MAG: response regulator [Elusimicrobia bacterium]|nr:response regulator [Elusimicrobiota bacterium]